MDETEKENENSEPNITTFALDELPQNAFDDVLGEDGIETLPNIQYYELNNEDVIIKSHKGATIKRTLQIDLMKCVNTTEPDSPICKPDYEIEPKLNDAYVSLIIKNNYFDFNDLESPINQYFQRENFPTLNEFYSLVQLNSKRNDYVLKDSMTQFTQDEGTFYSFQDFKSQLHKGHGIIYFTLELDIDSEHETYERSVYSFWEFIGLIGGIYEIMDVLVSIFIGSYNNRIFLLSVINKKIAALASQTQTELHQHIRTRALREEHKQLNHPNHSNQLSRKETRKRNLAQKQYKQF